MKDIIKVGMFVSVEEPSGKVLKTFAQAIKNYEPQITKVIDTLVEQLVLEIKKEKS